MPRTTWVYWLLSPIRSGSSITVYAAGAALRWQVADEVFGPWDRTGPPYNFPRAHLDLMEEFKAAGSRLTPAVAAKADLVFDAMGGQWGNVICKHPHESISPDDVRAFWPAHRSVTLLRNPLYALNSLFVRGWDAATGGGSMIRYFSNIGRRWLADPNRLVYDDLQRDPHAYFAKLFTAWGLEPHPDRVDAAVRYKEANYHHSSKAKHAGEKTEAPARVRSEQAWGVPEAFVTEYLADPLMREVFAAAGWPLDRESYPVSPCPV